MSVSKGDAVTYGALVTAAVMQAAEPWRKEAAMPPELHPILSSSAWSYAPLALLLLVGAIWLFRQFYPQKTTVSPTASQPLPAAAIPFDRIPVTELLKMATDRGWNFTAHDSLHLIDLQDAIRQGACDSQLTMWGKLKRWSTEDIVRNEVLEKIPPEHWRTFYVHLWPANDGDNFHTKSWNPDATLQYYLDLNVNRPEAATWLDRDAVTFKGKRKPDQKGLP